MVSRSKYPNNVPRFKTNIRINMELAGNTEYLTHIKYGRHDTSYTIVEPVMNQFVNDNLI